MLIIDIQYFANVIYYKYLFKEKYIIFDKYENFRKMSFHNRCIISGANGPLTLSVPVEGGRDQKKIFHEVRIANREKWQRRHWRSIESAYNRSPWFEYYRDSLAGIYDRPFERLIDWNRACLEWSLAILGADLSWKFSDNYQREYTGPDQTDLRGKIHPRAYPVTGEDAAQSIAGERNTTESITPGMNPIDTTGPEISPTESIRYSQVFSEKHGFLPNLSILDLIFCEGGKEAFSLLKKK